MASDPSGFASEELRIFSLLREAGFSPETIFDIGAANGTWSALVSEVFPDAAFHMFEPLAKLMPAFEADLKWQMQNHPSFTLHPIALGSEQKTISMRIHADGYSSTILDMGEHPDFQQRSEVPQYRLDDFLEMSSLPLPNLIKIDVQGAERVILSHAPRCLKHAELIFAETWFVRGYGPETPLLTELVELLGGYDFELAELGHRFYDSNHRLYGCDAFFAKQRLLRHVAPRLPARTW